jgi:hypothetical protein
MKWHEYFYPIKTGITFLDAWTVFHLAFWLFFGSCVYFLKIPRWQILSGCMALALAWEIFEKFAEKQWPHVWLNPESWVNSWISDPLTCVVGVLFSWYILDNWRP